jgi:tetratricopeptide (TPR) repeat protein
VRRPPVSLVLALGLGILSPAAAQVVVREEAVTIPTWEIGPPEIHPVYPGPQGPIYPYTLSERLTDKKAPRTYRAVTLENEYVQLMILPELGGRIHGAIDKTNGYRWLYWQPTIKPGLISMTGAWISGGIEWNFPHGHRPSGFMPVDHTLLKNPDGSITVWVGETEPIFRMRWLVGITLAPGRSSFTCDYVFVNPTDRRHSFQFWATSATHANEWSQAQYPGHLVTGHGKDEFWRWPIHDGVDLSWWKNVPNASSFFAWESQDDWFGTYDHKAQAGLVHVADHRVMPGKKLWTWGSGPSGRIWEDILTEGGGPYFEPQAGAWSDNQPDYHWMEPGEVRRARDVWYPVRDTRGFRKATEELALNVDVSPGGKAFAGVYATSVRDGLTVTLEDARGFGRRLVSQTVRISPDRPFTAEAYSLAGLTIYDLTLRVSDASGKVLAELTPQPQPKDLQLPAAAKPPGASAELKPDELLTAADWLDRFRRRPEALAYYTEALRRDPADPRANAALGGIALDETRWTDAISHFDKVLARDPGDGQALFGRGTALLPLGRTAEAEQAFVKARQAGGNVAVVERALARLSFERGDASGALAHLKAAESANAMLADLPALRAAAHRMLGDHEAALAAARRALSLDPMHFVGGRENALALGALGRPAEEWVTVWRNYMRDSVQNQLELGASYIEAGLLSDAEAVLNDALKRSQRAPEPVPFSAQQASPMIDYLLGYVAVRRGQGGTARLCFVRGNERPLLYANPHRVVEALALEAAVRDDARDSHARHLLGNVLYGLGRREEALFHWKEAARLSPELSLAWRNVGYGERQLHSDDAAAAKAYRNAFLADETDARVLLELDQVEERLRLPAKDRLVRLDSHFSLVEARDDLVTRWIDLKLQLGGPMDLTVARGMLHTRHFRSWEGGYAIHHRFVEVNHRLGELALKQKDWKTAIERFQEAFEYPKNLEVAPRTPEFKAHLNWALGRAYFAAGRQSQARAAFEAVMAEKYARPGLGTYYQALAARQLGRTSDAVARLAQLEEGARALVDEGKARGRYSAVGEHLLSLVLAARGDESGAAQARGRAEQLDPRPDRAALTQAQVDFAGAHQ